jgi:hypothetical protein
MASQEVFLFMAMDTNYTDTNSTDTKNEKNQKEKSDS